MDTPTPPSPRRRGALVLAAVAAPLLTATSAAPVSAAPPPRTVYDALGDSYAAGVGAPPYLNACGESAEAYGHRLDGRKRIDLDDFVACGGATTATVRATQRHALDAETDLVTLTVGGNDIGWGTAVGACLAGTDQQCAGAVAASTAAIRTVLPALLDATYADVAAAAPGAEVVVTGYPRLFSPENGAYLGASPAEQQAMNDAADLLNAVIADAAERAGFADIDVTSRFDGHGVNATDPWILGPGTPGAFHPTPEGHEAYAAAVTAAVGPGTRRG